MSKQTDTLRSRIRSGSITRADVIRRLAELAFGDANDCVRLAQAAGRDTDGAQAFLQALQGEVEETK